MKVVRPQIADWVITRDGVSGMVVYIDLEHQCVRLSADGNVWPDTDFIAFDDLESPEPFEALPVEHNKTGRHRPGLHLTVKQDPALRAIAKAAIAAKWEDFVKCNHCGVRTHRNHVFDHDCAAGGRVRSPAGGSCTFTGLEEQYRKAR